MRSPVISVLLLVLIAFSISVASAEASYEGNHCLSFDGVDDLVTCSAYADYYRSQDFTVEFWFKPNYTVRTGSNTEYGYTKGALVSYTGSWCGNGGWALYFDFLSGKMIFRFRAHSFPYLSPPREDTIELKTDRDVWYNTSWWHIAVVHDTTPGDSDTLTFYVNGESETHPMNLEDYRLVYEESELRVGRYKVGNDNRSFCGRIDEMRFWNVTRTQEEILGAWDRTLAEEELNQSDLVGYWRFDREFPVHGTMKKEYLDLSGYGNNASSSSPYDPRLVINCFFCAPIIPEYSMPVFLSLFMIVALLVVIICHKTLHTLQPP